MVQKLPSGHGTISQLISINFHDEQVLGSSKAMMKEIFMPAIVLSAPYSYPGTVEYRWI